MKENLIIKPKRYASFQVDIDDNFKVVSISDGFSEITGFSKNDIDIGLYMSRLIPTDAYNEYLVTVRDCITENGDF